MGQEALERGAKLPFNAVSEKWVFISCSLTLGSTYILGIVWKASQLSEKINVVFFSLP